MKNDAMIPAELRKIRSALGLTQSELAKSIGVSPSLMYSMEAGRRKVSKTIGLALRYRLVEARAHAITTLKEQEADTATEDKV